MNALKGSPAAAFVTTVVRMGRMRWLQRRVSPRDVFEMNSLELAKLFGGTEDAESAFDDCGGFIDAKNRWATRTLDDEANADILVGKLFGGLLSSSVRTLNAFNTVQRAIGDKTDNAVAVMAWATWAAPENMPHPTQVLGFETLLHICTTEARRLQVAGNDGVASAYMLCYESGVNVRTNTLLSAMAGTDLFVRVSCVVDARCCDVPHVS